MIASILVSLSILPGWCSDSVVSNYPLDVIRSVLSGPRVAAERIYAMPALPPDSAIVVRDEAVCERAARAYYRGRLGPTPPGGVTVIRVGNRFAVFGAERAGEWSILTIFSDRFDRISNVAI